MICLVVLWITMLLHCTAAKMQRTVIVMQAEAPQLKLYIRGGVDINGVNCQKKLDSPIDIHIRTNATKAFNSLAKLHKKLQFCADSINGRDQPYGVPLAYSTNDSTDPLHYQPLNKWGPHNWLLEFDMDCSKTKNGWFQFYAVLDKQPAGVPEKAQIQQQSPCQGSASLEERSGNITNARFHVAHCGYINRYCFNSNKYCTDTTAQPASSYCAVYDFAQNGHDKTSNSAKAIMTHRYTFLVLLLLTVIQAFVFH